MNQKPNIGKKINVGYFQWYVSMTNVIIPEVKAPYSVEVKGEKISRTFLPTGFGLTKDPKFLI